MDVAQEGPAIASPATLVAIAWCQFQPRTEVLASTLGGESHFIHRAQPPLLRWLLPLRYLVDGVSTWRLLNRKRPRVVIAITPPVFAPLVAYAWCRLNQARLVMDCHTTALHSGKWGWALPIHRRLARAAAAVTLHTKPAAAEVAGWSAPALFLPDDVPDPGLAEGRPAAIGQRVVVAGSLDGQEPVEATIEAARLLPDVEIVLTGDIKRVPLSLRQGAPGNVVFTGWLDYPRFLGELQAANVVAAFSRDPGIMNRAAFEAIGLGKPLVLTDFAGLRDRFGDAAVYCSNQSAAMADAIRSALAEQEALEQRSLIARKRLASDRQMALRALTEYVGCDGG